MLSHALACSELLAAWTARADHLAARRECAPPVESGSQDLAFRTGHRLARRSRATASLALQRIPAVCCLRARPLGGHGVVGEHVEERRVPVDAVASSACDFFDDRPQYQLIEHAADGRGGRARPGRRLPDGDGWLLGRRVEQSRGGSERRGCARCRCPAGQLPPGRGLGWVQPRVGAAASAGGGGVAEPGIVALDGGAAGVAAGAGRCADNKVRLSAGCSLAAGLGPRSWWPQPWAATRLAAHRRWYNDHRLSPSSQIVMFGTAPSKARAATASELP